MKNERRKFRMAGTKRGKEEYPNGNEEGLFCVRRRWILIEGF